MKKFLVLACAVLILVLGGVLIFFRNTQPRVVMEQPPEFFLTERLSAEELSSWSTYENKTLGYRMLIPDYVEIKQDQVGGEESISARIKKDVKTGERLSDKKLMLTIEKPKYTDIQPILDQEYFKLKVKELAKLQFDGFDGLELRETTWQKKQVIVATIPSGAITCIYVWNGTNLLSVSPTAYADDISLDLKILSTVKFAE